VSETFLIETERLSMRRLTLDDADLEHARADIGLARIIAIVSPDNAASIGLTEKLGLQFEKTAQLPGEDKDVSLYSMSLQE